MKKLTLVLLSLLFMAVGCEKDVINRMESLYKESMGLNQVTADSVKAFSAKVNNYVEQFPEEIENPLYPLILENIETAKLKITIILHDEWEDTTYINFGFGK